MPQMPQIPQLRRHGGQSTPRAGDSPRDRMGRVKVGGSNCAPHLAVISRAQVYAMELFHANGQSLSVEELQQQLESILELSARAERGETRAEAPIGLLTSLERDTWAHLRDKLVEVHPDNESALLAIESALFVVVLEGRCPEAVEEQAKTLFLGDARNRWFDKSFQLIVFDNATAGISYIHIYMCIHE